MGYFSILEILVKTVGRLSYWHAVYRVQTGADELLDFLVCYIMCRQLRKNIFN